jgi:hypothetical protein
MRALKTVAIRHSAPTAFLLILAIVAITAFVLQDSGGNQNRWYQWRGFAAMAAVFILFAFIAGAMTKGSFYMHLSDWLKVLIPFALVELSVFWLFRRLL